MPKRDKAIESAQASDLFSRIHNEEIRTLLQTDQKFCDFATAAPALAALGLRTHPLRKRNKAPIFAGWQGKATTNLKTLKQWAENEPHANVGIVAGAGSGVIVVDLDLRHGARASLDDLKRHYGPLPPTWEVFTPGGWHLYFRHPGSKLPASTHIAPGVDVRGDGANVVAPGSIHTSGACYLWNPLSHPDHVPLAEVPDWLLERLGGPRQGVRENHPKVKVSQVELLAPLGALAGLQGVAGSLNGELVRSLYTQTEVIEKLLPVLGLGEREIGEKFHCIWHEERHASAAIMPPLTPGGTHDYVDFHEREHVKSLSLPYVYYRLKVGPEGDYVKRLNPPSHLVWSLRLLRDAGVIEGVKLEAPRLPEWVSDSIKTVYAAFLEVLSLKFLVDSGDPSPFTWRFAMAWTGLSKRAVTHAMKWLLSRGYIRFVRYFGGRGLAKKMMLFLQGTRQLIQRRLGALVLRERLDSGGKEASLEVPKDRAEDIAVAVAEGDMVAIEQANQAAEEAKRELKLCKTCGETREWVTIGDMVTCLGCWQAIDTS